MPFQWRSSMSESFFFSLFNWSFSACKSFKWQGGVRTGLRRKHLGNAEWIRAPEPIRTDFSHPAARVWCLLPDKLSVTHSPPQPMPEIFGLVPAHDFFSPPFLLSGNSVTFLHLFILTYTLLFSSLHSFFRLLFEPSQYHRLISAVHPFLCPIKSFSALGLDYKLQFSFLSLCWWFWGLLWNVWVGKKKIFSP